jgi:hypothetical protein
VVLNSSSGVVLNSSSGVVLNSSSGVVLNSSSGVVLNSNSGVVLNSNGQGLMSRRLGGGIDNESPHEFYPSLSGPEDAAASLGSGQALKGGATILVRTSALTGEGIHELKDKILALAVPARNIAPEGEFITNLRHQQLIKNSLAGLAKARQAAEEHTHHEMLLLDLYDALRPLDLITGATYADDILDIIFKTFCVGK